MLVLTRGKDQSIVIGEDVEVIVLGVESKYVRLGVCAPRSIPVHRKEISEKIKSQEIKSSEAP